MDQATLERMIRAGKITPEEILMHTPLDRLDETLTFLKQHGEVKEICRALTERISRASLT
jgi:hypothetical protein